MSQMRVAFILFHPISHDGGGERFFINALLSCLQSGENAVAYMPLMRLPVTTESQGGRFKLLFQRIQREEEGRWSSQTLSWRDVLLESSSAQVIWLHQYLGTDLVFDVFIAASQDQALLFTSLGYEPLAEVFWRQAPNRKRMAFIEISDYAASRVRMNGAISVGVKAALWRRELRQITQVPDSNRHICAIGRVLPHKGFETAIEALPMGYQLHIAGDCSHNDAYVTMLRAMKSDGNVIWRGQISDAEKQDMMASSLALAASSTHRLYDGNSVDQPELLGLVLLEAVNAGCLPLASRIPSFTEIMRDLHLEAWQFDERDAAGLRQLAIKLAALSGSERTTLLTQAQARLKSLYLWDDYWLRVKALVPQVFVAS